VLPVPGPSGWSAAAHYGGGSTVTATRPERAVVTPPTTASRLTDDDLERFEQGHHATLHEHLGAHLGERDGTVGAEVAVWAPHARAVSFVGDVNGWDATADPLESRGESGVWAAFVPGAAHGQTYRLQLVTAAGDTVERADPFAVHAETPPANASKLWDLTYDWGDGDWMASRAGKQGPQAPIAVYELHLGSWMRGEDGRRHLTYRELAPHLIPHVHRLGFTHVEFLPVMEHPFYGSWGYQTTGYFAPTSRYGTPQDLMWLIDKLHQAGIGVLLDWVPSHFPDDWWALAHFDGEPLYEHADPRRGRHPDWNSAMFDYGRPQVRSFLLSSARSWLDRYHADGLRVDAVSSMLYLDYSRAPGQWEPNVHGGNEHLEAIELLRRVNDEVTEAAPAAATFAEEATAWPKVTHPTAEGGLGFDFKWDLGWMHDTLAYLGLDPLHRRYHHERLTFRNVYRTEERFCLPLSHDEVSQGKGPLVDRMPGDDWQQRATLRLLLGYQFLSPGKKLVFMGTEFGQRTGWDVEDQLDWPALEDERHAGLLRWTADLASTYRALPALHVGDHEVEGFRWVDASDVEQSVIAFLRRAWGHPDVLIVANFTPVVRHDYRVGVPTGGRWRAVLDSDADRYGGSGAADVEAVEAVAVPAHGFDDSVVLTLPPLAVVAFTPA
jgi:1,4-alpha-glucan branching enzyme